MEAQAVMAINLMSTDKKRPNPFEGYTSLQEAARLLRREHSVLRYWAKKGYIQVYEIAPRVTLVNWEEVRAYAEDHQSHLPQQDS